MCRDTGDKETETLVIRALLVTETLVIQTLLLRKSLVIQALLVTETLVIQTLRVTETFVIQTTAVEVGVPKLGNCMEMYTCAQASVQFLHSMCTNLDTPCTLKLLLGHPLYTGAVYMLAHRLGHMCTFPSSFQAWALQLLQQ